MEAGDLPGAKAAIAKALGYSDDSIDLLLLDAQIKYMSKDIPGAFDTYSTVLAMDPSNALALQAVSQLGLSTGHDREAKAATEQILLADPKQGDALLISGIMAINDKDYDKAAEFGQRLFDAQPNDPRGSVLRARAAFLMGKHAEALAQLRAASAKFGNSDLIATALLECAREEGDAKVMLEQFALLRNSNPDSVDLAIDEANVRYKTGDLAGARRIGSEILDKHGDDATAVGRLSGLWDEYDPQPLDAAALAALTASGKLQARLTASRHYMLLGQRATALQVLGDSRDDRANGLRARIEYDGGNVRAAALAEDVLARDSSNCDALATRALAQLARRDPGSAVITAQQAGAECPDRGDGFVLLARAYAAKGLKTGVERAFADGIALRPFDRALSQNFAEWLMSQGRGAAAVGAARRLTQMTPAKASAWQLLARTCRAANDPICLTRAENGLRASATNFAMDLPPGQRTKNPLLGQTWM